jgi:2-polyprenyl-3-methyl-5-hydroxy-6-metoxy-1,4-benzoquinol methylase
VRSTTDACKPAGDSCGDGSTGPIGNVYDKYGTRNPIARLMMRRFLKDVAGLYRQLRPRTVLEVGCGEGQLAAHLYSVWTPSHFVITDQKLTQLADGLPAQLEALPADIYQLPFADRSFELVVCCEVLEHLERPEAALRELARVSSAHVLLSTPREPLWRLLNLARGAYLPQWGNTPGHLQHWSSRALRGVVGGYLEICETRHPLPWTVLLARTSGKV